MPKNLTLKVSDVWKNIFNSSGDHFRHNFCVNVYKSLDASSQYMNDLVLFFLLKQLPLVFENATFHLFERFCSHIQEKDR